jgi:NADH:ubiquinone oxidoreductase subunit E
MSTEDILSNFKPVKDNLLPILHRLQDSHPQNFLPDDALVATAKYLNMSTSAVYGVVGYYTMFSRKPRGKYIIRFCTSPVCSMMGSIRVLDWLCQKLGVSVGNTTPDGLFTIEESECLGRCGKAPSMMINHEFYGNLTPEALDSIIHQLKNS